MIKKKIRLEVVWQYNCMFLMDAAGSMSHVDTCIFYRLEISSQLYHCYIVWILSVLPPPPSIKQAAFPNHKVNFGKDGM